MRPSLVSHLSLPAKLSTVHKGAAFEQRALRILHENLSMSLRCVGGRADDGVDLIGWWWVPMLPTSAPAPAIMAAAEPIAPNSDTTPRRRIRVLAQCKAEKRKPRPGYIRELEGVAHRFMSLMQPRIPGLASTPAPDPLAALLVSEAPFTRATLLRAQSSTVPFLLLHLPPDDDAVTSPELGTAFWNPALAGAQGLLAGEVELRWERGAGTSTDAAEMGMTENGIGRPTLWHQSRRVRSWTPEHGGDEGTLDFAS